MKTKQIVCIAGLIVVAMAVLSLAACGPAAKPGELQKIVVAESARGESWLPMYLAYELGYFKDEGLEVSFVTYRGGPLAIPALLAGDAQFCATGYEQVMKTYEKGKETKMIVATTARHPWSLLARPEIKSFADLKGKTIAAGKPGSSARAFVRAALKYGGLDPDNDVVYVDLPTGGYVAAYDKGEVDAAMGSGARKLEMIKRGATVMVDLSDPEQHQAVLGADAYHLFVIQVTDDYIKEHPDTVQKFVNAVVKGFVWQNEHTAQEMAGTIAPLFPNTDENLRVEVVADVLRTISHDGFFTQVGHDAAVRLSLDVGMISKPLPFEAVVDNSFLEKAWASLGK